MNFNKAKAPFVIVQPRRKEVGRLLVRDEQLMNVVRERIVQRDQSRLYRILLECVVVVVQVLDRRLLAVGSHEIDGEHTACLVLFRILTRAEFHAVVLLAEILAHRWLRVQEELALITARRCPVAHFVAALRRTLNAFASIKVGFRLALITIVRAILQVQMCTPDLIESKKPNVIKRKLTKTSTLLVIESVKK